MENFTFHNTTKIIFGRKTEETVGKEIAEVLKEKVLKQKGEEKDKAYNKYIKILLHYGGDTIKKIGLYDRVVKSLKDEEFEFHELSGVKPNPVAGKVREGIKLCRDKNINFILAVGGGSVIDSAKAIAIGVNYSGDIWDFFSGKAKPQTALDIGVILTVPAAGSESSVVSVITDEKTQIKKGFHSHLILPKFSILNPELTFTILPFQTACGAADTLAHIFERYFTQTKNTDLTDRLCEAAMKTVIENTPVVLNKPEDYDARAEMMWASTIAHNGILGTGRIEDWASHKLGHELSAIYGVVHGAALSIIFPAWMKYVYKFNLRKFVQFAARVWGVDPFFSSEDDIALEGINRFKKFLKEIGLPTSLGELNIGSDKFEEMAEKELQWGLLGNFKKLNKEDIIAIYKLAL
ncbi:MAG: iron-containing alcohol dehydrogenase [Actinobacteria bacterium]|nr:iron-containing alcohol dehydrogenase [Actinomycetota bacterium]